MKDTSINQPCFFPPTMVIILVEEHCSFPCLLWHAAPAFPIHQSPDNPNTSITYPPFCWLPKIQNYKASFSLFFPHTHSISSITPLFREKKQHNMQGAIPLSKVKANEGTFC